MHSNIFRFIDDLCTFNNDECGNSYNDTYPDEPKMKKDDEDPCKAPFLDFSIEVHDRKSITKLFNTRDAFPFYINHMPYLDSDIPSKLFYALVGSEILHIARITTGLINVITRVNILLIQMKLNFQRPKVKWKLFSGRFINAVLKTHASSIA